MTTARDGLSPLSPSGHARSAHHPVRTVGSLASLALVLAVWAGCAASPTTPPAFENTKYTLEKTDRFALLDRMASHTVSCTGLITRSLADGRTELVANLKNREGQRLEAQASCVFRDEQGVTIEETAWQPVTLPENSTVSVRFVTKAPATSRYTVRVRDAR
jgi:hypothetical protein